MINIGCAIGNCPSGPTAGQKTREWLLADGRLVSTVSVPANRYGSTREVKINIWKRDGYVRDAFGSPRARGIDPGAASRWLAERGAIEVGHWPRVFDTPGAAGLWNSDVLARAAGIGRWYDLCRVDLPLPHPPQQSPLRIVSGTRRRRRARRRRH